jgi:hypothetical protein
MTTKCFRCDAEVDTDDYPHSHRTLTFNHEASAVVVCLDCWETAKERDIW